MGSACGLAQQMLGCASWISGLDVWHMSGCWAGAGCWEEGKQMSCLRWLHQAHLLLRACRARGRCWGVVGWLQGTEGDERAWWMR